MLIFVGPLTAQVLLDSSTAEQLEKLGEARYQGGQPDLALPYYLKAIGKDPARVASLIAAARILASGFRREQAVALYRRALALNPLNVDALAGLSESVPTWKERRAATRALASAAAGPQAALAKMRLRVLDALGDRPAFEAADKTRPYHFDLDDTGHDVPPGMTLPVLAVTAPDGSKLKLLIATAQEGIWLRKSAAKALGARILFATSYPWLDQGQLLMGDFAIIDQLELGDLTLRNCPVFVRNCSRSYMYGVDGIIGAEVFQDFLIEIGNAAADFSLLPHTEGDPPETARYYTDMRRYGPFLLVPVKLNPEQSGYFALGNITSEVILQAGKAPRGAKETGSGITRPLTGWLCSGAPPQRVYNVNLAAGAAGWKGEATSCRMDDLNRAAGFRVAGILGYSFLGGYTLVLDYRHGRAGLVPQMVRTSDRRPMQNSGEKWPAIPPGQ